ncbi:MAG: hypothetical protein H7144_15775 [Burkholderiales bacterium]|nr:hypothetical protein [Phycisphaerae bacterium]
MKHDVKLCDVVISNRVLHYDSAKITPGGTRYRPQSYPANALLLKQLQTLTGRHSYKAWQSQVGRNIKTMGAKLKSPEVHFGTIVSGSQVIAAVEKKEELLKLDDKIIAAEMEMGGVMAAVFSRADPKRAITIRGISDAADARKAKLDSKKVYRKFAAANPARLTRTFLLGRPVDPLGVDTFEAHLTLGAAAAARKHLQPIPKSSHLAFECAIAPCGPAKTLSLELRATNASAKPIRILEAVATYRDANGEQTKRLTPDPKQLVMRCELKNVSPAPINVYAATVGPARSAVLDVNTRRQKERLKWTAPSGRSK